MVKSAGQSTLIDEDVWDQKEFEWTGKSFYYIPLIYIFGKPLGLGGKLEQLNREARQNGYKILNNRVLISQAFIKGRAMIEVEKQDKYDAMVDTYEDPLFVDTVIYKSSSGSMSNAFKRLAERVAAKRSMSPRQLYYMYVMDSGGSGYKTILFAFS